MLCLFGMQLALELGQARESGLAQGLELVPVWDSVKAWEWVLESGLAPVLELELVRELEMELCRGLALVLGLVWVKEQVTELELVRELESVKEQASESEWVRELAKG